MAARKLKIQKPQRLGLKDPMPFGKYEGRTVQWVLGHDWQHIEWMFEGRLRKFTSEVMVALINIKQPEYEDETFRRYV